MKLADIINYEGDNTTFIWKHPSEDFNTNSQLIVHESQEAILFMNGQALDTFGPGRHTLKTQNLPILRRFISIPTDGVTPFHCEVYYINKVEQMAIKWGTDSKVQYVEPQYGFPLSIGASGDMSLRVEDSRRLLVKLVGTERTLTQATLTAYFRSILMTHVKSYLAEVIRTNKICIFQIDELLINLSNELKQRLAPDFAEYGVALERFYVSTIVKPDGEKTYERFKQIFFEESIGIREERLRQQQELIRQETASKKIVMESAAMAQKRRQEGYSYSMERGFDVAQGLAENEGVGNFSSAGIGLGMMAGVGGGMGAAVAGLTTQAMEPIMGGGVFQQAAAPANAPANTFGGDPDMMELKQEAPAQEQPDPMAAFKQRIDKLTMMKEAGLLSDEEFAQQKQRLLSEI